MKYTMSELAERSEVTARTIRFWIGEGLLQGPLGGKGHGAYYTEDHLKRLQAIREMKDGQGDQEGMTLRDIKATQDGCSHLEPRVSHPTRIYPMDGVELLIDENIPLHSRRAFIQAVVNVANSITNRRRREDETF